MKEFCGGMSREQAEQEAAAEKGFPLDRLKIIKISSEHRGAIVIEFGNTIQSGNR